MGNSYHVQFLSIGPDTIWIDGQTGGEGNNNTLTNIYEGVNIKLIYIFLILLFCFLIYFYIVIFICYDV